MGGKGQGKGQAGQQGYALDHRVVSSVLTH
jgi:hypothetical protein